MQYIIESNQEIARDVYRMRLRGETGRCAPGRFAQIKLDGFFLPRPISLCDWDESGFVIVYKIVGDGTRALAAYPAGRYLEALVGLGNGFDTSKGEKPLLLGGGVGTPPLYALAKALLARGACPTVALGFNTAAEAILAEDFERLNVPVRLATVDGSLGARGFVTDLAREIAYDYYYACGPEPMLRAVYERCDADGQLSFEARMACGFGACMGCTCQTNFGPKRVCLDGPVFRKEEVLWQIRA